MTLCRDDVNIVVVLKAMGAESDQEIIQLVGEEETFAALLVPTIQDCKQKGIFTQGQALDYLGERLGMDRDGLERMGRSEHSWQAEWRLRLWPGTALPGWMKWVGSIPEDQEWNGHGEGWA